MVEWLVECISSFQVSKCKLSLSVFNECQMTFARRYRTLLAYFVKVVWLVVWLGVRLVRKRLAQHYYYYYLFSSEAFP